MQKADVINYFGRAVDVTKALGVSKSTVSTWPEKMPENWSAIIHVTTNGALRHDPQEYGRPPFDPRKHKRARQRSLQN